MTYLKSTLASLAFAMSAATALHAAEPVEQYNSNAIWFVNWVGLSNATLTVAEPDGNVVQIHAKDGTPVYQLKGEVQDGVYRYELTAATDKTEKIVNQVDSGRGDNQSDSAAVPFTSNGQFVVERGRIITPDEVKEE